ncbi:MAG: 16S rRNA (uracil(1498)-N(3))-methyltransferase [Propionibacteriaceae bacterium]|jgi:16S rRNA (uracil1498-N3)-methyltransferase|nr:16S rRNA (uracil(1498)-N(3))-methyltransferase [Propionibacteriaceae bacterium]
MTEPLFLGHLDAPKVGDQVALGDAEGHHAADVRRIRAGEVVLISDGAGLAVRGPVTAVAKGELTVEVAEVLQQPAAPIRYIAVQALAKGDRSELAVEVLTEAGIDTIYPWQAERSIVKWAADRVERGLLRWRATAREAAKQSRRFRVPVVADPLTTPELVALIQRADLALVLHESAERPLSSVELPAAGAVVFVIGPEGGLTDAEVAAFTQAGAQAVTISDAVLRTSTAGVVALAQLQALAK